MIMASSSTAGGVSSELGASVYLPLPPNESISQQIAQKQLQIHEGNIASNNISFGVTRQSSSSSPIPPSNLVSKYGLTGTGTGGGGNYDLGELDQAFYLYLDQHEGEGPSAIQQQKQNNSVMRPPTLNIFPSQPMYVEPSPPKGSGNLGIVISTCPMGIISSTSAAATATATATATTVGSKKPFEVASSNSYSNSTMMDLSSSSYSKTNNLAFQPPPKPVKHEGSDIAPPASTNNEQQQGPPPKTTDPKTLRRLEQNREAARKSRLRKKAYVQQLESSRLKLTQLEQQILRSSSSSTATSSQGVYIGGSAPIGLGGGGDQGINPIPLMAPNITSDGAVFDIEYNRWVQENHQVTCELRNAVMQENHLHEHELRIYVNNCVIHLDELMALKSMIAKSDALYLLSGVWKTPAERCFMWLGGFRPFHLIKIITSQVEALTELQVISICELQHSIHLAEEQLSQGLQNLNQSLSDTILSDALGYPANMPNYMNLAINKLSTVEGYVREADILRQQAIHRLFQLLTSRQAARCCLGMAEYFQRLRLLSSLWLAHPTSQA